MDIKIELLKAYISDYINHRIEDFEINANEIADTNTIKILAEIQEIIKNENLSDFEIVEKISNIFLENNIDCGNCHDW